MIKMFNENVLKPLEGRSIDSFTRSHILKEALELILKIPLPFPSEFFTIENSASTTPATLLVSADPLDVDREAPMPHVPTNGHLERPSTDTIEVVENTCGIPCDILVCGKIPDRYLAEISSLSSGSVEITYSLKYDGPLFDTNEETDTAPTEEDESMNLSEEDEDEQTRGNLNAHITCLLPGGRFLTKVECNVEAEGYFFAKFRLNYIDPLGRKWNVPTPHHSGELFIKASFA